MPSIGRSATDARSRIICDSHYAPLTRLRAARRLAIRRAPVASIRQRARSTLTPNWSATSSLVAFRWASSLAVLQGVEHWFVSLEIDKMTAVTGAIDLLELEGPMLGRQVVDRG
jgi:hypothetical protein